MDINVIRSLIEKAIEKRVHLFGNPETDCFRIFNSSGDGMEGLTADYYRGYILLQFFRETVEEQLPRVIEAFDSGATHIPGGINGMLVKNRIARNVADSGEWKSIIVKGEYPSEGIIVRQNGIRMKADLLNGQNTGIFLDMREIRTSLADFYSAEKPLSMLNLFCYTGAFSIHALSMGVAHAVNVDLSKSVLKKARENYSLNNLKIDERDFIYGDSYEWVRIFAKKKITFNFAVFDPPTFSRNRGKNFSVKNDYGRFLENLEIIVPRGYVFSSINSNSVSREEYESFHPRGWELIMFANESSDFIYRGNPYLKAGLWKIS